MITLLLAVLAQDPIQPVKIPLPDAARTGACWSPDGAWVYYFEETAKPDTFGKHTRHATLFRTTADGKVERVTDVGNGSQQVYWHPDRKRLALVRCVEDTSGDGKVDFRDGDSLWMGDLDGKNGKDLVPAGRKKISFYGFLADEKLVLGLRDSFDQKAKIVIRSPDGKEEPLVEADGYILTNEPEDLVCMKVRETDEHGDVFVRNHYSFFLLGKKEQFKRIEEGAFVDAPRVAPGGVWYTKRVDSNKDQHLDEKDHAVVAVLNLEWMKSNDVTKPEDTYRIFSGYREGILAVRTKGAQDILEYLKERESRELWTAGSRIVSARAHERRLLIGVRGPKGDELYLLDDRKVMGTEEKQEAAGQAYLKRAREAWLRKPTTSMTIGMFYGRRWLGRISFDFQSVGSGYELQMQVEMNVLGKLSAHRGKISYDSQAQPTSSEVEGTERGYNIKETGRMEQGIWKTRKDLAGKILEVWEDSKPDLNEMSLFLYCVLLPPEGETLRIRKSTVTRKPGLARKKIDGQEVEVIVIEEGDDDPTELYFKPSGEFLGGTTGSKSSPLTLRVVSADQIGKDLPRQREFTDPERVFVRYFEAVHKGDVEELGRVFDFTELARRSDPTFDELTDALKEQRLQAIRESVIQQGSPLTENPFGDWPMEDFLAPSLSSTESGDQAEVQFDKRVVATLRKSKDSGWRIVDLKVK